MSDSTPAALRRQIEALDAALRQRSGRIRNEATTLGADALARLTRPAGLAVTFAVGLGVGLLGPRARRRDGVVAPAQGPGQGNARPGWLSGVMDVVRLAEVLAISPLVVAILERIKSRPAADAPADRGADPGDRPASG